MAGVARGPRGAPVSAAVADRRGSTTTSPPRERTPAPLAVVRGAPQGEVALGAEVTVTFSQAMVPLSSVAGVEARAVPVRLSPQPAGRWRWIDVRTIEVLHRGWHIEGQSVRPDHRMVAHTGFLTHARLLGA